MPCAICDDDVRQLFYQIMYMSGKTKSHLLDPLNMIFKLALLNICEPGTRLSITNHVVSLDFPTYSQAAIRLYRGDGKNDLYLLLKSVVKIVEWYITEYIEQPVAMDDDDIKQIIVTPEKSPKSKKKHLTVPTDVKETKTDIKSSKKIIIKKVENKFYKNESLKEVMIFACKGLERLQNFYEKQYEDGMFMIGMQLIVNTLKDGTNGVLDIERLPVNYRKIDAVSLIHIQEIVNFWSDDKIKKMLSLLQKSDGHIKDDTTNSITDTDNILSNAGIRTILNGYVESILTILKPLDEQFTKIVQKSYS